MTALANVIPSTNLVLQGEDIPPRSFHINIRLNIVIDPVLRSRLPAAELERRGMISFGLASFIDTAYNSVFFIHTNVSARVGNANSVTNQETYVTLGSGSSMCSRQRVGNVETDMIPLAGSLEMPAEGFLEHELGHALGCRHTHTSGSMMYDRGHSGNYRGYRLGVSDAWCIIFQLDLYSPVQQYLSSGFIHGGRNVRGTRSIRNPPFAPRMNDVWRPGGGIITNDRGMTQGFSRRVAPPDDFGASLVNRRRGLMARLTPSGRPTSTMTRGSFGV